MSGDGNLQLRPHLRVRKPMSVALLGACLACLAKSARAAAEHNSGGDGGRDEPCSLGWGINAAMLFVQVQLVAVAAYAFNPSGGLGGGGLSRMLKRIGRWMAALVAALGRCVLVLFPEKGMVKRDRFQKIISKYRGPFDTKV